MRYDKNTKKEFQSAKGGGDMMNQNEMGLKIIQQRTEVSREFFDKTGMVIGAGFGPGARMLASPLFGMMFVSTQTGVYDFRNLVAPVETKQNFPYNNAMLNLWDMALKEKNNNQ